jgi:hypothetical protein
MKHNFTRIYGNFIVAEYQFDNKDRNKVAEVLLAEMETREDMVVDEEFFDIDTEWDEFRGTGTPTAYIDINGNGFYLRVYDELAYIIIDINIFTNVLHAGFDIDFANIEF